MTGKVTVVGAGVLGLWQALVLARRGFDVRLIERSDEPFAASASRYGGTMLAPDCEGEAAPEAVVRWGRVGIARWTDIYPGVIQRGSLVVAGVRDRSELKRFAAQTHNHRQLNGQELGALENDLADRFTEALLFPGEAHLRTGEALTFLLSEVQASGGGVSFGTEWRSSDWPMSSSMDTVIDCTGMAARDSLPDLRGVRGERLVIRTQEIQLSRPVRLLHPRHPIYVVPWGDGRYTIGATVLESEDSHGVTVRSALELLGSAYALHPAFGEAEILELGAGLRPAYEDNVPRIRISEAGRLISVNGAYRHGFLLAPVLADAVADFIQCGSRHEFITE